MKTFPFSELMHFEVIAKGCRSVGIHLLVYCLSSQLELKLQEGRTLSSALSVAPGTVPGTRKCSVNRWGRNE